MEKKHNLKMGKRLNRHFTKKDIRTASRQWQDVDHH